MVPASPGRCPPELEQKDQPRPERPAVLESPSLDDGLQRATFSGMLLLLLLLLLLPLPQEEYDGDA